MLAATKPALRLPDGWLLLDHTTRVARARRMVAAQQAHIAFLIRSGVADHTQADRELTERENLLAKALADQANDRQLGLFE